MTVGIRLLLFAPMVAAAALAAEALSSPTPRSRPRRIIVLVGLAAAVTGGVLLVLELAPGETLSGRGFGVDLARAGLAAGVALIGLATVAATPLRWATSAPLLVATAAGVGSIVAEDVTSAAAFIATTTVALGVAAWASGARAALAVAATCAAADIAMGVGLLLAASEGLRVPPAPGVLAGILLAVAAGLRSGALLPSRLAERALEEDRAVAAVLLGAVRAQGIILAVWAVAAQGSVSDGVMVAAAAMAAVGARRAVREASASAAITAQVALAIAGIALASGASGRGAVLLMGAAALASTLMKLGSVGGLSAPSIGAAPLGAALPGAALIVSAMLSRAHLDAWMLTAVAFAAAALVWLAQAGVAGFRTSAWDEQPVRSQTLSLLPLGACLAIAIAPAAALAHVAHAAPEVGIARALGAVAPPLTDRAGVVAAIIAVVVLFVLAPAPARPVATARLGGPAHPVVSRALVVGSVLEAVAIASVVVLVRIGVTRGFL